MQTMREGETMTDDMKAALLAIAPGCTIDDWKQIRPNWWTTGASSPARWYSVKPRYDTEASIALTDDAIRIQAYCQTFADLPRTARAMDAAAAAFAAHMEATNG